jgi:hypothetical protein
MSPGGKLVKLELLPALHSTRLSFHLDKHIYNNDRDYDGQERKIPERNEPPPRQWPPEGQQSVIPSEHIAGLSDSLGRGSAALNKS